MSSPTGRSGMTPFEIWKDNFYSMRTVAAKKAELKRNKVEEERKKVIGEF